MINIIYENKQYWIEKNENLKYGYWVCAGGDTFTVIDRFETEAEAIDYIEKLLDKEQDD